ncbi:MAG: hypothetical protein ACO3SP_03165 [Ilumatobacteraceae bacterium]
MTDSPSDETRALRYDERPDDPTPITTMDLPATPQRDRNIPASAWIEAPAELLALGADLACTPVAHYKRRIGRWLLWRAGPATDADARYWAADCDDLSRQFVFQLASDGHGRGLGPSGTVHERFRSWKEDLRDH